LEIAEAAEDYELCERLQAELDTMPRTVDDARALVI
jgi:hypothetical protein